MITRAKKSADAGPRAIVVITHLAEPSGAPRVTLEVADHLRASGRRVVFVAPGEGTITDEARARGLDVEVVENAPHGVATSGVTRWPSLLWQRVRAVVRLASLLRRQRAAAAWVGSTSAWAPLIAPVLAGVPLIVHVHESLGGSSGDRARIRFLKKCARALVFVADWAKKPFIPRPRRCLWTTVANPIDPARYTNAALAAQRVAVRASLDTGEHALVALCVAFVSQRKGHDQLLRALALAKQHGTRMVVWCAGAVAEENAEWAASLHELAKSLGVEADVRWLGLRRDVPALLAAADVLVLASREEAAPLSIAEAMMAARSVVAMRVGAVDTMVGDGYTGRLVEPGDVEAFAEALVEIASSEELRRERGEAGRRRALERYSPARFREGVVAVIERVAPKRNG